MRPGAAIETRRFLTGALYVAGVILILVGAISGVARADGNVSQTFTVVVPDHTVPTTSPHTVPSTPTTPTTTSGSTTPTTQPSTSSSGPGPSEPGGGGGGETAAPPRTGTLPRTGFDPTLIVAGVLLILMGLVLQGVSRLADTD